MSLLLAVAAVSSAALGVRAECESLASAAQRAGAASLLSAVTRQAPTDTSLTALNEVIHSKSEVSDADKLTFFAPTDAAFAQGSTTLDADGLLNHFVDDAYTAEELFVIAEFHDHVESEMARDLNLRHDSSGALYLTPDGTHHMVQVIKADIPTCAGMLHLVDAVLVPGMEEAIKEKSADDLLVKDLSALTEDLQVMGGRSLLDNEDREARRERLRIVKRRVALRNRIAKRKAARLSRGGKRQVARTERREARAASAARRAAAKRKVARHNEAVRAVAARKAAAEARKAAGRMRSAGRHSKGKKGGKKGGKKHKKDRKPRGMDNGSLGHYGESKNINGLYAGPDLLHSRAGGYGDKAPINPYNGINNRGQYGFKLNGLYAAI